MTYSLENLDARIDLEKKEGKQLRDINHSLFARLFKCVYCGQDVNSANIVFYHYHVADVMCYECQKSNKGLKNTQPDTYAERDIDEIE